MTYRESYLDNLGRRTTYYFDIGHHYVFNSGQGSHGIIEKNTWKEHHIPYQKKEHKDYTLDKISSIEEIPPMYLQDLIRWVFVDYMER